MALDGGRRNSTPIRRAAILAATLDCYVDDGPGGTFITEVCSRAEVSVGTLYHHFGSKEQLLATLHLVTLNAYQAHARPILEAHPSARQGILDTVRANLCWLTSHPREATFLLRQPFIGFRLESVQSEPGSIPPELIAENEEFLAVVRTWLAARTAAGELRELSFDIVVALLIGPIHHWMRAALHAGRLDDVEEAVVELGEGAWEALRRR